MSENDSKFSSEILPFQRFDPGEFVVRTIQNDPTLQPSTKHQYIKAIENYDETILERINKKSSTIADREAI